MKNNKKENGEGKKMQTAIKMDTSLAEFIKINQEVIQEIIDSNTVKNSKGLTVVTKDDPWRNETEWDKLAKDLKNTK